MQQGVIITKRAGPSHRGPDHHLGERQGIILPSPGAPNHSLRIICDVGRFELAAQVGTMALGVPPGADEPRGALSRVHVVVDVFGGELHPSVLRQTVTCKQKTPCRVV